MKAGKDNKKCLLVIVGKGSAKAPVIFQVKGIQCQSLAKETLIKDGKAEKIFLLDGGNDSVHVKSRDDSWGMERSEERHYFQISLQPCLKRHGGETKDSWWME